MTKVVKLADYKSIEAKVSKIAEVSDEAVELQVTQMMASQTRLEAKEGAVENGDVVTLDFEGFKDGVAFDGGKAEGYQLEIGSHTFIPGFEEQMVGMVKEETRDLNLTFPENYGEPSLAGAAVVFTVTVHEISTKVQAELTDEFVASLQIPEVTTVEGLKEFTRQYLEDQENRKAQTERENMAFDILINNSEVELDDDSIERALETQIQHMEYTMQQQGFTLDQYLQMTGMSMDALKDQLKEPAKQQAKFEAIIDYIIEAEQIDTTDEEVDMQASLIASQNGLTKEDVFQRVQVEDFKRDINRVKASQTVLANVKFIEE